MKRSHPSIISLPNPVALAQGLISGSDIQSTVCLLVWSQRNILSQRVKDFVPCVLTSFFIYLFIELFSTHPK